MKEFENFEDEEYGEECYDEESNCFIKDGVLLAYSGSECLTVPEGVTEISKSFEGFDLVEINISKSVKIIHNTSFKDSNYLYEIKVHEDNENYCSVNGILYSKDMKTLICYPHWKNNPNYQIPDGITTIEDNAFFECDFIKSVYIPDTVTKIGKNAFSYCYNLSKIHLSKNITEIGEYAFFGTQIESVDLPESCTEIGPLAFCYCQKLKEVSLPGVDTVPESAFERCINLEKITLSKNLKIIGKRSFLTVNH